MFSRLTATVLFVQDLAKCMAFYEEKIGLTQSFKDDVSVGYKMGEHDFLLLEVDAAKEMVGEETLASDIGAGHRVLLCVQVEDVHQTFDTFTAKGIEFLKAPKNQDWGRCTAYFADPEGNLWELWHSLSDE